MRRKGGNSGQTVVEYLMLLALTFVAGYLVITFGVARGTRNILLDIRQRLLSLVRDAEGTTGAPPDPGTGGHPSDPARAKGLHL